MSLALRNLYRVPFVGWAIRDATAGRAGAGWLLFAYGILALTGVVVRYGYPALIIVSLAATAVCLLLLVVLTAGDLFSVEKPDGTNPPRR